MRVRQFVHSIADGPGAVTEGLLWIFLSWAFVLCPLGVSLGHLLRHRIDGSQGIGMFGLSGY